MDELAKHNKGRWEALAQAGFIMLGLREGPAGDAGAAPGTWDHLATIIPPFNALAAVYQPALLASYL